MVKTLCCCLLLAGAQVAAAQSPRGSITIDRIAEIKYPTDAAWSPDGAQVAFLWDFAGKQDLYVVTPGAEPVALTDFPVDPDMWISNISGFAWVSPDEILFGKDGQLWSVSPSAPKPARVAGLSDAGAFVLSADKRQVAFTRKGQIVVASLEAKIERQLTFWSEALTPATPQFSRDGRWLAFTATRGPGLERYPMPYNGDRIRSFVPATSERRLGIASVHGGDVIWVPTVGAVSSVQWTGDGAVLYEEKSPDGKTREIKVVTPGGAARTLWRDHDERWWSPTNRDSKTLLSPDGKTVAFVTDRSGWIHVYVMPVTATSEAEATQLTSGAYLAGLGDWSPDSRRIAYHHSVPGNQMERFLSIVDVATGASEPIVAGRGVSFDPRFSPDGSRLVYPRTDVENSLDLYVVAARPSATPVRLSDSMPTGLDKADLVAPSAVSFPSRHDGHPVPATLMVPHGLDRTRKHPAIVWIHGSGSDQNFLGWHPGSYRMYYSVSQYLVQQGYIVLTPDYRGSSGYSRDWSTGVHMGVGVSDAADVASGADYLKTLDYVDPDRIGVWGLSYGGFLTLQALTQDPTLWRCGIDVAGVVDWTYRGAGMTIAGYTIPRLGSPVENPAVYSAANPIEHMSTLERPLLIMHGTDDRNVAFHDSLRLIDLLVKQGKDFDTVIYPGEIHFFRRAIVLRDAWKRAERFFDEHLKRGPVLPSQ
ncbi:MAG: prolyl oligopeptidase family serine peptidase, partial [Vicinamibacterales bacterium]